MDKKPLPVAASLVLASVFGHFVLNLFICKAKQQQRDQVVEFNPQNMGQSTNLGGQSVACGQNIAVLVTAIAYIFLIKSTPKDLESPAMKMSFHIFATFGPFTILASQCIGQFVKCKNLRNATKRLFCKEPVIYTVNE